MRTAHVDEAGACFPDGRRLYVVAAALSSSDEHPAITEALTALVRNNLPLHFHDQPAERRELIAKTISTFALHGAIVVSTPTTDREQESARARLLCDLLPRLCHVEQVRHVVLESRAGGDRHDRRTLNHLRQSRRVSTEFRLDHERKQFPLLWVADWLASSYVAATRHGDTAAWKILNAAHPIEVTEISP